MFARESNILVVDDSVHMRRLIADTLYQLGFRNLVSCADTHEALKSLMLSQSNNKKFDLILSDLNMPGPNGIELLRQVRASELFKEIPFILITTESEKGSVLEAAQLGVSSYIVKPFTSGSLYERLIAAYNKHYGSDQSDQGSPGKTG